MLPKESPAPKDWPAAQEFTCGVCNNACQATTIEKGSVTAVYVCAEQHDTFVLAAKDPSGEAWEFGVVPF